MDLPQKNTIQQHKENDMKLTYYTDGGCEPNPGKGTWAFVAVDMKNTTLEEVGHDPDATNNKMEMTAIIRAIENAIEEKADAVEIFTDSQYCVKGFHQWMLAWAKNNWRKKLRYADQFHMASDEIANLDLWQKLYQYRTQYALTMPIRLTWVRGHAGNQFNERCDELVRQEYKRVFGGAMQH